MMTMRKISFFSAAVAASGMSSRVQVNESLATYMRMKAALSQDSECSAGGEVTKDTCFGKGKCMFMELEQRNLCLPCEWGGAPIPCFVQGASIPQGTVQNCEMTCSHNNVVTKISDCTDVSGDITAEDCYSKGTSVGISCMWTEYKTRKGDHRTMCGPCKVDGFGTVARYTPGTYGPEYGSVIVQSRSQCDDREQGYDKPCFDQKNCPTVQPPMPPVEGQTPQVIPNMKRLGIIPTEDAPEYYAAPVSPPFGEKQIADAAEVAAKAAGWTNFDRKQVSKVDLPQKVPGEGPVLPETIQAIPGKPLPGLLFPHRVFPEVVSEPGGAFTPKLVFPPHEDAAALLQREPRRSLRFKRSED